MKTTTDFKALRDAISLADTQSRLAEICADKTGRQIKQGHISNWLKRGNVPSDCALVIEQELGVKKEALCPTFPWHILEQSA